MGNSFFSGKKSFPRQKSLFFAKTVFSLQKKIIFFQKMYLFPKNMFHPPENCFLSRFFFYFSRKKIFFLQKKISKKRFFLTKVHFLQKSALSQKISIPPNNHNIFSSFSRRIISIAGKIISQSNAIHFIRVVRAKCVCCYFDDITAKMSTNVIPTHWRLSNLEFN